MYNIMEFKKEDLLTYDDIEKYLSSGEPTDRSKIICNKLKNYVFINNGVLFVFDIKTILYKRHEGGVEANKNRILYIISAYLTSSKKGLEQRDYDLLKSIHTKHFINMSENAKIGQTMSQIIIDLTNDEKKILGNEYEIHFLNGYLDMKTNEFKQRVLGSHFVVDSINREYKKSKKSHREELKNKLRLIYPINEDFKTILYILGSAMTGKATKLQKILFLLGKGSAGKSSIMQITKSAVECYFDELGSDAFSMSNKNKDKTFSTFYNRPFVRIIWINEPKTDKMEKSTFKSFCEGQMKGTLLFRDKEHDFGHNGLPIFTANEMPNIDVDDGVKRRIRGYEHLSKFTDDANDVDASKNIYLKDIDFIENIKNSDALKNAWVDILCLYGHKWFKGETIPDPITFQRTTKEMIQVNDHFQDFVDAKIKITGHDFDRIGKNAMHAKYKEMFKNQFPTLQKLIGGLKEKGIVYDGDKRCDNMKGSFIGVKFKDDCNPVDDFMDDDEPHIENDKVIQENKDLKKEIERLTKLLNEKNAPIKEQKPEEIKPKSKKVEDVIEEKVIEELIEPTKKAITKEKKDIRLNEYETIALMKYYDYVEGKINRSEINKYDNQFKTVLESFATIKEDLALVDKINVYFNNKDMKERVLKAFIHYEKQIKEIEETTEQTIEETIIEPQKKSITLSNKQIKKQGTKKLTVHKKETKLNKILVDKYNDTEMTPFDL